MDSTAPQNDEGEIPSICENCPHKLCATCPVKHSKDPFALAAREKTTGRLLFWVVFVVSSVALLAIATILVLTSVLITVGNNHHAETAAQNRQITAILTQHSSELNEVKQISQVLEKTLPAADAVLYAEVIYLNHSNSLICMKLGVSCGTPPTLTLPTTP